MNWLDWLQVFFLYVALGFAYAEIRRLRGRVAASEKAVQQIADAIRYAAERAANSKEGTHE